MLRSEISAGHGARGVALAAGDAARVRRLDMLGGCSAAMMAAVLPGASRAVVEAATADVTGTDITPSMWRSSVVLRDEYWMCIRCSAVMHNSEDLCRACKASFASMTTYAGRDELDALEFVRTSCAYGKRLRYVSGRTQVEAAGVNATPGTPGYAQAVFARTNTLYRRPGDTVRVEPELPGEVNCFDGWLLMRTAESAHRARIASRANCRELVDRDDVEALLTEWVQDHGRVISVPGSARPVQVHTRACKLAAVPFFLYRALLACSRLIGYVLFCMLSLSFVLHAA